MLRGYFELGAKVYPETKLRLDQLNWAAKKLGYRGIGICNHSSYFFEFKLPSRIFQGVEILARDLADLKLKLKHYSAPGRYLALHGGDPKLNRIAARSRQLHILMHPGPIDAWVANYAALREVAIQLDLSSLITTRGIERADRIIQLSRNFELISRYGSPYILSLNVSELHQLRAPKQLIGLAELIGLSAQEARRGLMDYPRWILESAHGELV